MRPDNNQKLDWKKVSIIFAISLPFAVLIAWEFKNPTRGYLSSNEDYGNMFLIGLAIVELMFVFFALLSVGIIYLLKWAGIYDASWILGTPVDLSDYLEVEEEQGILSPLMQRFLGSSNEIQEEEENGGVGGSSDMNRPASSSIVRGSEVVGTTNETEEENRVGGSMNENGNASSSILRQAEAVATGIVSLCAPVVTCFFVPNPSNDRDERGAQRRRRNTEQSNLSDVAEDESSAGEGGD